MAAFSAHKNIAYRFMPPSRLCKAIDISVTYDLCIWTRVFLMFRGISDMEMGEFVGAGEKEAINHNWRAAIGWTEESKNHHNFRVMELSILECS